MDGEKLLENAKKGDTVHVHYVGRLDDGTVFDSSEGREPLEFKVGEGRVIPGFEKAVEGLAVGEKKASRVPADQAYGQRSDELIIRVPREELADGLAPAVGQRLEMVTTDGRKVPVTVIDATEEALEVDANHPLAGQDLTFEVELVKIA
jgi:peptidylprolyl isomerase